MLCAHYDSVSTSPGVADNASGVAVVLEALRALMCGPLLDRDVVALLDDGEEDGSLGAVTFVKEHPWAKEVGVVINLDARGNSGPSIMFETSDGNGWLIRQYSQAVPHPLATSLSVAIAGLQTGRLSLADLSAGAMVSFIAMCAAVLAVTFVFMLGFVWDVFAVQFYGSRVPWLKFGVLILTGCAIVTAAVTLALNRWSVGARSLVAFGFGALFWWLALTLITARWFPGSSYLFVWPTLFGVLGLGVSMRAQTRAIPVRITTLLCVTPALVLFPPLFHNMFDQIRGQDYHHAC